MAIAYPSAPMLAYPKCTARIALPQPGAFKRMALKVWAEISMFLGMWSKGLESGFQLYLES